MNLTGTERRRPICPSPRSRHQKSHRRRHTERLRGGCPRTQPSSGVAHRIVASLSVWSTATRQGTLSIGRTVTTTRPRSATAPFGVRFRASRGPAAHVRPRACSRRLRRGEGARRALRIGEAGRGRDFPGGRPRLPESAAIRLRGERRSLVCSFRVGVIPRPRAPAERRS